MNSVICKQILLGEKDTLSFPAYENYVLSLDQLLAFQETITYRMLKQIPKI